MVGLARNCSSRKQTQEAPTDTGWTAGAVQQELHYSIKTRLVDRLTSVNSWKGAFWKRVSCHNSGDRKPYVCCKA